MSYPQQSAFIKLSTGEYPKYEGDIRREHPEIPETATWPNFPCPSTYAVVHWESSPEHNFETHTAYELPPKNVDGVWRVQWAVRPFTEQELADMQTQRQQEQELLHEITNLNSQTNSNSEVGEIKLASENADIVIDLTTLNP